MIKEPVNQYVQLFDANRKASAAKMIGDSDRHLPLVTLGDNVRVSVLLMDKSRADPPNVLALIIKEINGMYTIDCRGATINRLCARNQFEKCDSKVLKIGDINLEERSLRNIVENESDLGGQKFLNVIARKAVWRLHVLVEKINKGHCRI
ncbi:unnamed protein product [Didymodactylos carnosus]|uniref:Uncharacterized protein n=1 Tax=Didymodactylos carnosus TaxID=1234261 RepID=A0A8S2QPD6_9BILA|nr:unnamed protein product [Didymodactylos carnosus]CAF4112818.1 unnamed protein product [Didymodactylos carnosus]